MARGTGGVYLRGKTWHIHYSVNGIQHKESAKTLVKSEATALLRKRLGEAARGQIAAGNPDMATLLDGVAEDYEANSRKSTRTTLNRIERLKERWGAVKAKHFTASQVKIHIKERLAVEVEPATINRELAILRRAFSLGKENGQVATAPTINALTEDNTRQGFFSDAEFSTLREHLPVWMKTLADFAYFTGCRLGELRSLNNSGREDIVMWVIKRPDMIEKVRRLEAETGRTFFAPMVPGRHTNDIDVVLNWALTIKRGGSEHQPAFPIFLERPACESKYGLCE